MTPKRVINKSLLKSGIDKTPDEVLKMLVKPAARKFTFVLNKKNPIYPKQPLPPKNPDGFKKLIGINVSAYNAISIKWSELGDNQFSLKLLKEPFLDEYGNNKTVMYDKPITKVFGNSLRLNTMQSNVKYTQVVIQLKDNTSTSNITVEVELLPSVKRK